MQSIEKVRQRIAVEAARLLAAREETLVERAKLAAARRLYGKPLAANELPTNAEVRLQLRLLVLGSGAETGADRLAELRQGALRLMRLLRRFRPRLVHSALDGRFRHDSDIDLEAIADGPGPIVEALHGADLEATVLRHSFRRRLGTLVVPVVRIEQPHRARIVVFPPHLARRVVRPHDHQGTLRRANLQELEDIVDRAERVAVGDEGAVPAHGPRQHAGDRFELYAVLLAPLEHLQQDRRRHPEGDALYHSLQVFELARAERPYDEEFLLAALLHDVGKVIDPQEPIVAGVEALGESITERTRWLIEHQAEGRAWREGTLGHRSRRRLEAADDFEELVLLADFDRAGRKQGVQVMDVHDALDYLRQLDAGFTP
ncbi:MAG: HD domain-containing protein [Pirellulales bacterium]|nr:HD domain-containing protein [Pirellulales bacterium]